jgi:flagellar biosynthetic protein FliP
MQSTQQSARREHAASSRASAPSQRSFLSTLFATLRRCFALAIPVLPILLIAMPSLTCAQTAGLPAFNTSPGPNGGTTYSLSVQTMLLLTMLSFLPAMVLMMTSFTRIIIVLSLLPNQVLVGLALFLTLFIMSPVLNKAYTDGYKPFSDGTLPMDQAVNRGLAPFKTFMLRQTRESDLALFARISHAPPMQGPEDVPSEKGL